MIDRSHKLKEKLYMHKLKNASNSRKPPKRVTAMTLLVFIKDIAPIIMAIVAIWALNINLSYYEDTTKLSSEVKNLSEKTACLQKESRYSQISPPKIIIMNGYIEKINPNDTFYGMKSSPYYDRRLTFKFNFIPTSKQFFYPDINETDRSWGGFVYSISIDNNTSPLTVIENKNPFQYQNFAWGYRNETLFADVIYDILIRDRVKYNFSANENDEQKRGNITVNFTFRIRDINGNSYNDTISYIIYGWAQSPSLLIPKEFKFNTPEIYRC